MVGRRLDQDLLDASLSRAESFGDLLAWCYLPVSAHYALVTDKVRADVENYRRIRKIVRQAVHSDVGSNPLVARDRPELTVNRLKQLFSAGERLELILHATLVEVDDNVGRRWRHNPLTTNGERSCRNRLYRGTVKVHDRRISIAPMRL